MKENQVTVSGRSPEQIAAEIVEIKTQSVAFLKMSTSYLSQQTFEIGRRLTEAKEILPHGEWLPWLKEQVDYSEHTAQNLMRIYREYDPVQNPVFAELSYKQMVDLFALPQAEREAFVVENNVQDKTSRELKKLLQDYKESQEREKVLQNQIVLANSNTQRVQKDLDAEKKKQADRLKEIKDLRQQVDELSQRNQEESEKAVVYAPSPEDLEKMRHQIRVELEEDAKKQEAKDALKQNPKVLEINVIFKQIQYSLDDICRLLADLREDDPKLASEMQEKIKKGMAILSERALA